MVIFFVVIWKHVWRIIVYKVKEKKTRGGIHEKNLDILAKILRVKNWKRFILLNEKTYPINYGKILLAIKI